MLEDVCVRQMINVIDVFKIVPHLMGLQLLNKELNYWIRHYWSVWSMYFRQNLQIVHLFVHNFVRLSVVEQLRPINTYFWIACTEVNETVTILHQHIVNDLKKYIYLFTTHVFVYKTWNPPLTMPMLQLFPSPALPVEVTSKSTAPYFPYPTLSSHFECPYSPGDSADNGYLCFPLTETTYFPSKYPPFTPNKQFQIERRPNDIVLVYSWIGK